MARQKQTSNTESAMWMLGALVFLTAIAIYMTEPGVTTDQEQRSRKLAAIDPGFAEAWELMIELRQRLQHAAEDRLVPRARPVVVNQCVKGFCSGIKVDYLESKMQGLRGKLVSKTFCTEDKLIQVGNKDARTTRELLARSCGDAQPSCEAGTYGIHRNIFIYDIETNKRTKRSLAKLPKAIFSKDGLTSVYGATLCIKDPDQPRFYRSKEEKKQFHGDAAIHTVYRSNLDGKLKLASTYFSLQGMRPEGEASENDESVAPKRDDVRTH